MGVSIHGGSQRFYDDDNCTPNDLGNLRMGVSINGGTLSHYPFLDGIVPETNHPAIGVAPWLWKPHLVFMDHNYPIRSHYDSYPIPIPFIFHSYPIPIPLRRYP